MPLSDYGLPIRAYVGTGTLQLRSGVSVLASFEAGQFANGDVFVLTHTSADVWDEDAAARFVGLTTDGRTANAVLDVSINVLGNHVQLPAGTYFAHRASVLRVGSSASIATLRYGIVNFRFFGTETFTEYNSAGAPIRQGWRLPLDLVDSRGLVALNLMPVVGYSEIAQNISTTRGIAVTCEAVIEITALPAGLEPDEVVSDLCLLLSVARGTRVQWLYRRELDPSGVEVAATHISHITRNFQGMEPLDHRAAAGEHTKRFLETGYGALSDVARTYAVRRGLIAAYIDSRSEDDFLEMRGVKLAVVAEMIKAQHGGGPSSAPPTRPRFGPALRAACREAGFRPTRAAVSDFVASRNRLIHAGRFRSDPAASVASRFATQEAEYFFMLSFVDRFFLSLFRYTGPFLDWSRYPGHEQGTLG